MTLRIDRSELVATVRRLVAVDSVNPELVPGGAGETEIARVVAGRMRELGMEVVRLERTAGRPSVVGRLPGDGDGPSLTLNAHLDTVGVEGMDAPFAAELQGERLYGRGAYDMKGSLAACLAAVRALREGGRRLRGDLVVAAVADEEHASLGTREVLEAVTTDAAVVTEPTGLGVCVAHKGFVWTELEVEGRAAHGSRPELGVDANLRMGRVLWALEELAGELEDRPPHPRVGRPSLHVGRLRGGTAPSVYASRSLAVVERRTVPGESGADVEEELDAALSRLRAGGTEDSPVEVRRRTILVREPFETTAGAPVVRAVRRAAETVLGRPPPLVGEGPWMDAALYAEAGVDTVVLGPAGGGAHADEEWVEVPSLVVLARILAEAALSYCGES